MALTLSAPFNIWDRRKPILAELLTSIKACNTRRKGSPSVTLSYAQSLDGCITGCRGKPYSLSGAESQKFTHSLRAIHDAVLVGIDTVIADDPSLTVRLVEGNNPLPVVLDSRLRLPVDSRLLGDKLHPLVAATTLARFDTQIKLEALGARIVRTDPMENGWVNLPVLLGILDGMGINNIMVEGGSRVITSFLTQGLVDWIVITIAPTFLAGLRAIEPIVFPKKYSPLNGLLDAGKVAYRQMGNDIIVWAPVSRKSR